MNDDTNTFLSLMVSGLVKPFIINQLCLLFWTHNGQTTLIVYFTAPFNISDGLKSFVVVVDEALYFLR